MIEAVGTRARGLRSQRPDTLEAASAIRRLDWWLLGAVAGLLAFGLWAIHGITAHDVTGNPTTSSRARRSTRRSASPARSSLLFVDPQFYRRHMWTIYIGTTGVMLLVLLAGTVSRHSKRWLDIGFFRFQPSEFGKLLFVLFLAAFLADRAKRIGETRTVLETIGLGLIPILLVFVQPDIGTAMVYTAALAAVLFVAGVRWVHLAALGIGTLVVILAVLWLLPASGVHVLKDYQAKRLTGFTHPDSDPAGATYNVAQAPERRRRGRRQGPRRGRRDPDEAELPAGARDRLRVRLARRAARLRRRLGAAAALPARRLARPEGDRDRA